MKDNNVCALCQAQAELCESHYMPQGLFKVVSRSYVPHDAAPVLYNANTETTCFTNFQPKSRLLCSDCEQKFSKYGENEIIRNCYQSSSKYHLLDILRKHECDAIRENRRGYLGQRFNEELNVSAYYYFALSILWRGSIAEWPQPYNALKGMLGSKYTDLVANYLLNPLQVIPDIFVNVYVDFDAPSLTGLSPPSAEKFNTDGLRTYFHSFVIPGARFVILVGGDAKKIMNKFYDDTQVTFYEWSFTNSDFSRGVATQMKGAEPKGKLAKQIQ